jgi:hypothetical protein
MKTALTATLIAALAAPAMAGGPVIVEEEIEVVAEKPASSAGALPLILLLAIGIAIASGGGSGPEADDDDDDDFNTIR